MKHLKFNTDDYEDDCLPGCDAVQFGTLPTLVFIINRNRQDLFGLL